ncbi:ABC transporter substrate-binding protein [Candidatus Sumerlaeota bacterium]|nr:ABC transporter substrate-binding protein [Candidatus Sumerlaeota bacterium]
MKSFAWLMAIALVATLGAGAFAQDAPEAEAKAATAAADPIKIGAVFAITGKAAWLGAPEANVVKMMVEDINAKGGIHGRPVEVIVKDDQADETASRNAVGELLRENVVAIVGPSTSGCSMAVAPMCEEEGVPLVSCAALAKIVEGREWVFKTPQRDDHVVERIYDYVKEKGMTKVALMSSTDGFGAGGRATLQAKAPEYGLEIVADETYDPKDTDMTAQLTKIKAAAPDAIVNWTIAPAQSIVLKNAKQLGVEAQIFQSHGFGNYQYLAAAGDAAEGVIFPAGRILAAKDLPDDNPQKALLVDLTEKYEAKYNDKMSTFAGHAYDALQLVFEACQNKEPDRQDIRDYIEERQGFVGTGGVFNFSPEDHTGLQKDSLEMLTVKDGQFTTLAK